MELLRGIGNDLSFSHRPLFSKCFYGILDKIKFIVEDKKAHKRLGIYLGVALAEEFFAYKKREKLLNAARKIKESQ